MTDNIANLRNYQIQLQQVDQALINDPDDEELKLLQKELNVSNSQIERRILTLYFFH